MINNFEHIKKFLIFESEDDYYLLQILRRKKENSDVGNKPNVVKTYYIDSIDFFDRVIPEIIAISNERNSRAYINLNRRSFRKTAIRTLQEIANNIESGNYKSARKAYEKISGKSPNEKDKKWVIDIDWKDFPDKKTEIANLVLYAIELQSETDNVPMSEPIPTKNGIHYITRPFNLKKFNERYPKIEVHKDRYTLLYIP